MDIKLKPECEISVLETAVTDAGKALVDISDLYEEAKIAFEAATKQYLAAKKKEAAVT